MSKTIVIHSFRRGTGKTNLAVNMAVLLAAEGKRIGVVDANFMFPGVHILFNLKENLIQYGLTDYLKGEVPLKSCLYDVSDRLPEGSGGQIFCLPAASDFKETVFFLREGYDPQRLVEGLEQLIQEMALDVLIVDTQPGLTEEVLYTFTLADVLAIILRPNRPDYQGTAVALELARKLNVPELKLIVNEVPPNVTLKTVQEEIEQTYNLAVSAIIPHHEDISLLGSKGVFVLLNPDHELTGILRTLVKEL